jgi:hypothetical protein
MKVKINNFFRLGLSARQMPVNRLTFMKKKEYCVQHH